jgi:hypothetical protein
MLSRDKLITNANNSINSANVKELFGTPLLNVVYISTYASVYGFAGTKKYMGAAVTNSLLHRFR